MAQDKPGFADYMRAGAVPLPAGGQPQRREASAGGGALLPPDTSGSTAAAAACDSYRQNGIAIKNLRQLQHSKPAAQLDMHGMTSSEAHAALEQLIRRALTNGWRVLEVIHGRGAHSEDGVGVLRGKARYWLQHCHYVLAYCQPPKNNGSLLVLLRQPQKR